MEVEFSHVQVTNCDSYTSSLWLADQMCASIDNANAFARILGMEGRDWMRSTRIRSTHFDTIKWRELGSRATGLELPIDASGQLSPLILWLKLSHSVGAEFLILEFIKDYTDIPCGWL
jgi:hypothetical protein